MFDQGDRIRIDIPDNNDPDFSLHGRHGEIIELIEDDADSITGRENDRTIYRIKLDDGTVRDVRGRDVRTPLHD